MYKMSTVDIDYNLKGQWLPKSWAHATFSE